MGKGDTAESMAGLDTSHCHPPLGWGKGTQRRAWLELTTATVTLLWATQHGSSQNLYIPLFSSYPLFPQAWQSLSQATAVP